MRVAGRVQLALSSLQVPKLVVCFFAANLALASTYLLNYALGQPFRYPTRLVDLDAEANLPAWYASMQLALVAALLGLLAYCHYQGSRSRSGALSVLALLFLALSADEVAGVHEWLGGRTDRLLTERPRKDTLFGETGTWMFVIGIPGATAMVLLILAARPCLRAAPSAVVKYLAGMAIFAAGSLGVETLANFTERGSAANVAQICLEEFLEMTGVTVMLWASIDLLRAHRVQLTFDRPEPGRTSGRRHVAS